MSTLSLRLPKSLHEKIRELAERENISINQFVATAAAEKAAALLTVEYLEDRAQRGDSTLFDRVLDRVPDVPPVEGDELPGEPPATNEAVGRVGGSNSKRDTKRKRRRAR